MVGRRPPQPYNVQFNLEDCREHEKVSLSQLDVPPQHRGLIKLTTAMLDKYHAIIGCSVDR